MKRVRVVPFLSMVVACIALGGPIAQSACAQRATAGVVRRAKEPVGAEAAVARLPRSAELIVVVDNAAEVRHAGLVQVVRSVLGPMPELEKTWAGLSRDLGWAPDETFDRLLGTRVVLVARGVREGGEADEWALISDISLGTDQRLVKRLEAAPKDIIAGYQLLAVEGGRYKLALHRRRGADGEMGSTAVLGPAEAPGLLAELISVVAEQGPAAMAGTPACEAVLGMGPASAVLLQRDPGPRGWEDYTAVSLRRERAGLWVAGLAVRDAALREDLLRLPRTGSRAFEALAEGALAAAMEARLPDEAGGDGSRPVATLLRTLGVPHELRVQLGAEQAAVVRAVGPRAEGGEAAQGGVAVAMAMQVRDVAETAVLADRYLAALCGAVDPESGAAPQFGGVAPAALRVVPISPRAKMLRPLVGTAGGEMVWVIAPEHAGKKDAGRGGWWVLGAGPSADGSDASARGTASVVRSLASCVAAGSGAEEPGARRWLTRGVVRPAALAAALPGSVWPEMGAAVQTVGLLRWEALVTDEGEIRGRLAIERAEPSRDGN